MEFARSLTFLFSIGPVICFLFYWRYRSCHNSFTCHSTVVDGFRIQTLSSNKITQKYKRKCTCKYTCNNDNGNRKIRTRSDTLSEIFSVSNDEKYSVTDASTCMMDQLVSVPARMPVPIQVAQTKTGKSPIEKWLTSHINVLYDRSLSMKCPFIRRRSTDLLEGIDTVIRFLIIRHKSLQTTLPPLIRVSTNDAKKNKNLNLYELAETIRTDWKSPVTTTTATGTTTTKNANLNMNINAPNIHPSQLHKGYYITGKLNTTIYRDDCWFDGPDPDMPVKGLKKYLNAASQLFHTKTSTAELLSLQIYTDDDDNDNDSTIVAQWKLQGVLHLPWRPQLPVLFGSTIYHFDKDFLIEKHEEFWDVSVLQAFMQTLWPEIANLIWGNEERGNYSNSNFNDNTNI